MTKQDFLLKLRNSAWVNKKIIFFSLAFIFAVYCASAAQVSVILEDNSGFIAGNITHEVTAYNDVNNVTIIDYFSDVKVQGIDAEKGEFLGKEWLAIKIQIGDMKKGEKKTMGYKILEGKGEAVFGADIYYLDGEKHQLFPKKEVIDIINENKTPFSKEPCSNDNAANNETLIHILLPGIIIIIIILVFIFIKFRK